MAIDGGGSLFAVDCRKLRDLKTNSKKMGVESCGRGHLLITVVQETQAGLGDNGKLTGNPGRVWGGEG